MTEHEFETHQPVQLHAEIGKGSVQVEATDTTRTRIEVAGRDADEVAVRQDGDRIDVIGPRQRGGFFGPDHQLDVVIVIPSGSTVSVRTGSADITVTGTVGTTALKSGSGDIELDTATGALVAESGSGDIRVEEARAELKVKSGSGDVLVVDAGGRLLASTGSGSVQLWTTRAAAVVKTGSGDVKIGDAGTDLMLTSGSGDLVVTTARRGRVTAKSASGDVHVGVPAGLPVWTDVSTVSGEIRSTLRGAGAPEDGAEHLEVRAKVVSGDVVLTEV